MDGAAAAGRHADAMAALGRVAGFAPNPVLRARLDQHEALWAACADAPECHDHPAWAALLDAVTVQETRLFRHPAQCAALAQALPARAAAARAEGRALRLLSAGCATGEEAFTLAALAADAAPGTAPEVVGLDLSRPALALAETGVAATRPGDDWAGVPPALRGAAFRLAPQGVALARRPGLSLEFRRANLARPLPALGGFDVVFCRNLLIYLLEPLRAALVARLMGLLRPGGVLGLGPTDRLPPGAVPAGEALLRAGHG